MPVLPLRLAALSSLALLAAQPPDPLTLRTTARLVEVSLVVHDAKGRPVSDLRPEEIEVFERGRPQKILRFLRDDPAPPPTPPQAPAPFFSNRAPAPAGALTAILIDTLNTPGADQSFARDRAAAFLQEFRPGDRVALYLLGRTFAILHDYTSDPARLRAKLAAWRGDPRPGLADSNQPVPDSGIRSPARPGDPFQELFEREADLVTASRPLSTLAALEAVARHMAGFPGRKNLLWITGGLPLTMNLEHPARLQNIREKRNFGEEAARAVRALNAANVALYSIDARGLFADPQFGAAVRSGREARDTIGPGLRAMQTHWEGMGELAEATGGRLFINRNDVDRAIADALHDARVSYTLAYSPPDEPDDHRWRDIKVRVKRDGLRLRHRAGYFARPEIDPQQARQDALRSAAWSPLDASLIALQARAALLNSEPAPAIGLLLQIDVSALALEYRDGRWSGSLEIMVLQRDAQGRRLGPAASQRVGLHMDQPTFDDARANGLMWPYRLPRQPGATELKIIVRDNTSGALGSVTIPHHRMEVAP